MLETRIQIIGLCVAAVLLSGGCTDPEDLDPCSTLTCSGHGECVSTASGEPRCECETGYESDGLRCVPTGSDGDADGDSDGDADGDADSDADEETEPTGPPAINELVFSVECTDTGAVIDFSAETEGEIDTWEWDFGDGVTSPQAEPSHFYAVADTYDVSLTVTGPEGTDSLVVEDAIWVIEPGLERMIPNLPLGDIRDMWQDPSNENLAFALGRRGLAVWDGTEWEYEEIPGMHYADALSGNDSGGGEVMIIGEDDDYAPQVWTRAWSEAENADPDGNLPHGTSDRYLAVDVVYNDRAFLLVDPSASSTLRIWEYNGRETPRWIQLSSDASGPNWVGDFDVYGTWENWRAFALQSSDIYRSNLLSSTVVTWERYRMPNHAQVVAVHAENRAFVGGSNGYLARVTWSATAGPATTDISPDFLGAGYEIKDFAFNQARNTLFALAVYDVDDEYDIALLTITNLDGTTPTVTRLAEGESPQSMGDYYAQMAAYGPNHIWYGTSNGYIALWNGSSWEEGTEITAGDTGFANFSPSGRLYVPVSRAQPEAVLVYDGVEWETMPLPESIRASVVWPGTDEDVWVLGRDGRAFHYDGSSWADHDLGDPEARFWTAWGSSPTDIWALGESGDDQPLIMHYNGSTWFRDDELAHLLGVPFWVAGASEDDIYMSSQFGLMVHWDGSSWSHVTTDLFAQPANFGECVSVDPSATCSGEGFGFTFFTVSPDGTLFAGVAQGEYGVVEGTEAGCSAGQYRCVMSGGMEGAASMIVSNDGTGWEVHDLPEAPDGYITFVYGMAAPSSERVYVVVVQFNPEDSDDFSFTAMTYDGVAWTPLPEQPSEDELFAFLVSHRAGEFFGTGMEGGALLRYQECH